MATIVTLSGTSRPNNRTSQALAVVNDELEKLGLEVVTFDARHMELAFPGYPKTDDAVRMQEAVRAAAGVMIATPEYHGTFTAMTKLMIENLGFPSVLKDKPVALLGVASGRIGAIKSLEHLRGVCSHTGAIVLPGPLSVAGVHRAFDEDGTCTDTDVENMLRELARSMANFIDTYVRPRFELESIVRANDRTWSASV